MDIRYKSSTLEHVMTASIYIIMTLFAIITLYPFIHVLSVSLSSTAEAIRPGLHFYPAEISIAAYKKVFAVPLIWTSYKNTIFVVVVGTIMNMIFTTLVAYPLSRRHMIFRNQITLFIVFTMLFQGGLIPTYLTIRNYGLINNLWVLILPVLVNQFNMIIMKNFFQNIPVSLEESVKIDGGNDMQVLVYIILPLSAPVIATIALFYAVYHWNTFFSCMIYINDQSKYVLQVVLRQLVVTSEMQMQYVIQNIDVRLENSLPLQDKYATIMVATIPILALYPFLQKYFVKGVLIGAIKG